MGIDKRDYMHERRDPGLRGRWAVMSVSSKIILLNAIVFVLWQIAPNPRFMRDHFMMSWSGVFEHGRVWTLVTHAFSHQGFFHLLWNMAYLHYFGIELEQIYGRRNFSVLYLHGAITAGLAQTAWNHGWGVDVPGLGASGAVMAVVIVTAIFYPQRIIYVFMVPAPLWLLAFFKLLGDLTGMVSAADGVGHAAHLGGALAGAFFWFCDLRIFASPGQVEHELSLPSARSFFAIFGRLFARREVIPIERTFDPDAARVDDILRKITREGMASLTVDERAFLEAASRKRR
ncbi:MAG: rhomboid family intramembrane serine protease [Planctomycetota bacterium]